MPLSAAVRSRPAAAVEEEEEEMAAALTELQPVPTVDVTAAVSELFVGMKRPNLSGPIQHKVAGTAQEAAPRGLRWL